CRIDRELIATRGERFALFRTKVAFEDGVAGPSEVECFNLFETDEQGRMVLLVAFNLNDFETAKVELDARAAAQGGDNLAWRVAQAHADYVNTGNWDALAASLSPDFEDDDRRTGVGLVARGEQARQVYRTLLALDQCRQTRELVASRGDRLVLVRSTVTFADGDGGPAEVVSLNLFEVNERGAVTRSVKFNVDDLAAAFVELDARAGALAAEF
ncbi:MAG TPA: nuclear transport factor 2 family protein, partial [Acidimicrobiia bacterium]|nr:nuclear transport factor 2 family protein [Acidimicrobiia bacterium]